MMHILIANNVYPPIAAGGAELIVAYLAEELVRRNHRVTVVSTCGPEMEPYPVEQRNGVEVIRFFPRNLYWSFSRQGQGGARKALWHLRDAWNRDAARRFGAMIGDHPPILLHSHLIDGFSAAIWARAKRAGMKVVHTAHDYHLLCPRAFLLTRDWTICHQPGLACRAFRRFHIGTTSHVDLFTSPSEFLLDLHRRAGLRSREAVVVRNGIPLRPPSPRPPRRGPHRFILLARLTMEKGIETCLEAMARLPSTLPIELVIGGVGPLEEKVRAAAASDPRIRYVGYVSGEEKHALLDQADHLLLPSLWYENAPVVILEAAAYGLGVIASRIGGIPEFVQEGRTGWLFAPGDAGALALTMTEAMRDPEFSRALPKHATALIDRSTVGHMTDAFLSEYDRVLQAA
jgi:glycosyltransferase involved in cell wall biosynthesis